MFRWRRRGRSFLDPDDETWQTETWTWFLQSFGGVSELRKVALVTPTRDFFQPTEAKGHERALHIFSEVKRHGGMASWPCTLVAQPVAPESRLGELAALKIDNPGPAGTFRVEGSEVSITYDPSQLDDPVALVATFAHELCHYRLRVLRASPPGGEDVEEFVTDLATVFFGFGLFGASCAFRFAQHGDSFSQGWRWKRHGYLDQRNWCYALATFLALTDRPVTDAEAFLARHLYQDLRGAVRYLRQHPDRLPDVT